VFDVNFLRLLILLSLTRPDAAGLDALAHYRKTGNSSHCERHLAGLGREYEARSRRAEDRWDDYQYDVEASRKPSQWGDLDAQQHKDYWRGRVALREKEWLRSLRPREDAWLRLHAFRLAYAEARAGGRPTAPARGGPAGAASAPSVWVLPAALALALAALYALGRAVRGRVRADPR
jgi:hypothetical protein